MFKNKYSTILTVILIILILAIIIIATVLTINTYKNYKDEKEKQKIYADLQSGNIQEENTVNNENTVSNENTISENLIIKPVEDNTTNNTTGGNSTSGPKTQFYKDYPVVGYIKIPKTKTEYPILLDISPGALEIAVGIMYPPSNPKLNQPGNTVIIGHNYRNGKFFSNNKKLVIGDKIQITDLTGKTLTYTIYEISQIPDTDTEYITRERGDNIEISLSTCTDDGKDRLVILAKVE